MTEAAAAARTLVVERVMPHPPEKVRRALTQAPLIEPWLMQNDFQPVVGHRFNLRSKPMPHWNGVVDCDQFFLRDGLFRRMWFGRRVSDLSAPKQ